MRYLYRLTILLMLAAAVAGPLSPLVRAAPLDGYELPDGVVEARFVKIVDGDTFIAEVKAGNRWREETIRMIGIDTPETSYSYGNEPECYGDEATRFADSILNAAPQIWLEEDRRDTDNYGRLLRYVWYEDPANGNYFLLNEELVYYGYALANDYRPNTARQDILDDAEDHAITESYGMWMECDRTVTGDPEQEDESGPSMAEPTPGGEGVIEEDVFCAVFSTYQEAQDFLAEFPEIAEYIDIDGDGIACEDWFP
jgi:endonuclease YncB( thermonuclease family)